MCDGLCRTSVQIVVFLQLALYRLYSFRKDLGCLEHQYLGFTDGESTAPEDRQNQLHKAERLHRHLHC